MTKMPTGKVRAMICVMRSSARNRDRRIVTIGPFPSSSSRAKPRKRQKSTVAGMIPSDNDRKGFDGMNWSMRSRSGVGARSLVLKNEASILGGNASWNEKYPTTQITQKSRMIRIALTAICRAVSRFRLPIPTMRERATEGRIVICQILMNASLAGCMTDARSPKKSPVSIPRMNPTSIQTREVKAGQFHGPYYLPSRGRVCTIDPDRRFPRDLKNAGKRAGFMHTGTIRHLLQAGRQAISDYYIRHYLTVAG